MATLTFSKKGNLWISEDTQVTNDYNLHIERSAVGRFEIEQKTTGTNFSACVLPENVANNSGLTIDLDISHGIYPKTIRVTSYSEVKSAEITIKA